MLPQDRNKQLGGNLPRQNEPTSLHGVTKVMEFCLGRLLLLTSRAIFQQVLFNSCPNRPMLVASPKAPNKPGKFRNGVEQKHYLKNNHVRACFPRFPRQQEIAEDCRLPSCWHDFLSLHE